MSESRAPRIELLTSPGCHLCEQARADVARVAAEAGLDWTDVDVTTDPALQERFRTEIPVVVVDGVPRDFWRVDTVRLARLLETLKEQRPEDGPAGPGF